jgi:hypothetical protein
MSRIIESVARQVNYFFSAFQCSEYSDWLLSGKSVSDFEVTEDFVQSLTELGYIFDAKNRIVKHKLEIGSNQPRLNKYWSGNGQWTLQADLNFVREKILGINPIQSPVSFGDSQVVTWRSFDRWILRNVFCKDIDIFIWEVVKSAEKLFPVVLPNRRIARPFSEIVLEMVNFSSYHDYGRDLRLTRVIQSMVEESSLNLEESQNLKSLFQPLLAFVSRRFTSHGVSIPFCMYDSDLMDLLFGETERLVNGLQDHGFQACISFGSVLGVVREGEMLGHDCDVDIAVGFEQLHESNFDDFREQLIAACNTIGFEVAEYNSEKLNFQAYSNRNAGNTRVYFPGFDVFPIRELSDSGKISFYHSQKEIDWKDLFPAKIIYTGFGPIKLPNKPIVYLDKQYGGSWKLVKPFALPY